MVTRRGVATRARLIEATTRVVRQVGYAHATTRAIAQAAGVAEGTIYRHYPDKVALFFAAVMDRNSTIIDGLTQLPTLAGRSTVQSNLVGALRRLSSLRDDILPLELALLTDPELATQRHVPALPVNGPLRTPPGYIADYLAAEQQLGRIRPDVSCNDAAVVLLATLFGLSIMPTGDGGPDQHLLDSAVRTFLTGVAPPAQRADPGIPAAGPTREPSPGCAV